MQKKLTITVDEQVYYGLYRVVGRRRISRFLENLARPHVVDSELITAYQEMAEDTDRELEAEEWVESLTEDLAHESG